MACVMFCVVGVNGLRILIAITCFVDFSCGNSVEVCFVYDVVLRSAEEVGKASALGLV